jgi:hypothetical protein
MQHHDHVRAAIERRSVAGLLVAAIPQVLFVLAQLQTQARAMPTVAS